MLRVVLANFLAQVVPLLMIAAAILLVIKAQKGGPRASLKRYLGISLASLPVGIIAYIFAGIAAAAIRGEGHFYSVPLGGYTVSDNTAIGISILFWIGLVFALLLFLFRPRQ